MALTDLVDVAWDDLELEGLRGVGGAPAYPPVLHCHLKCSKGRSSQLSLK